jgi:hypothetical protein
MESAVYEDILEEIGQSMYLMRAAHLLANCKIKMKLVLVTKANKLATRAPLSALSDGKEGGTRRTKGAGKKRLS